MAASSEHQFLNMIQRSVEDDVRQADPFKEDDASMSNLRDHQQTLNRHRKLLRHNIITLEKHSSWPRTTTTAQIETSKIDSIAGDLHDDFQGLLTSIEEIAKECNQGVRDLTNAANLAESQRAIAQARGVEYLTRLASVFIPLALLAGFFGMNFHEFGQGHLRLWIFFAAAAPTFVVSLFCLIPSLRRFVVVGLRIPRYRRRQFSGGDMEIGELA